MFVFQRSVGLTGAGTRGRSKCEALCVNMEVGSREYLSYIFLISAIGQNEAQGEEHVFEPYLLSFAAHFERKKRGGTKK